MIFFQPGVLYKRIRSIPPVFNVFSSPGLTPKLSFAELESAYFTFVHFSSMEFMCFVNVSLSSNIVPSYFRLST